MRAEENLIPIESDVQEYLDESGIVLDNDIAASFKELRMGSLLRSGHIKKRTGHSVDRIVFDLFLIPFLRISNVFLFVRAQYEKADSGKNRFYRFLENANYNWRLFQLNLANRVYQKIAKKDRQKHYFVVDETTVSVTGKLIEMASYVYDHTLGRSVLGFQKLTLGLFDGHHFVPIGQKICTSKRKPKAKSRATKYKKVPKSERIDPASPGAFERAQIDQSRLDKVFSLIKQAQKKGFKAATLLFDSWFCFNSFIIKIVGTLKLNVICQLKNVPRTNKYLYKGKTYSLKTLFAYVAQPKMRRVKKYCFQQAVVVVSLPESDVNLKIVFVQSEGKEKWHAFAATDTRLAAKAILEAYSQRWSIEVFFKNCKQYLNLGKEQMSNLDSIIASDALVMMRYTVLTFMSAKNKMRFYTTFDTLREQNSEQCFGLKLLHYFLNQLQFFLQKIEELLQHDLKEEAINLLKIVRNSFGHIQIAPQLK